MPAITAATLDIGANGQWKAAQGTITADKPAWNSTATWNSGPTAFTHLKANITDTASAAGSLLVDLQVGGVSQFRVTKGGALTAAGLVTASAGVTVASGQTLTLTGATVTGLTAASVAAGTFPGAYTITGAVTLSSTLEVTGVITGSSSVTGARFYSSTGTVSVPTASATAVFAPAVGKIYEVVFHTNVANYKRYAIVSNEGGTAIILANDGITGDFTIAASAGNITVTQNSGVNRDVTYVARGLDN